MKRSMIVLLLMLANHSLNASESAHTCERILLEMEDHSETMNFWSYLKILIDQNIISNIKLLEFAHALEKGEIINPIEHQKTTFGPVFSSSELMTNYKQIQKFIDHQKINNQFLDKKQLLIYVKDEIEKLGLKLKNQAKISIDTNTNFFSDEILKEIYSTLGHSNPIDSSEMKFIKEFPDSMYQLAQDLMSENQDYVAMKLILELGQIEKHMDHFVKDERNLFFTIRELKVKHLKSPLDFIKKYYPIADLESGKFKLLNLLDELDTPDAIKFLRTVVEDKNNIDLSNYALLILMKKPGNEGLNDIKNAFANLDNNLNKTSIIQILSTRTDTESEKLKIEILESTFLYSPEDKANLFEHYVGKDEQTSLEFIKKGLLSIHKKVQWAAADKLSMIDNQESLEIIKSLYKQAGQNESLKTLICNLLQLRADEEGIDILNNLLQSSDKFLKSSALKSLSTLNNPRAIKIVTKFLAKNIEDYYLTEASLTAIRHLSPNNILPFLQLWPPNKVPKSLITSLKGKYDPAIFNYLVNLLNQEKDFNTQYEILSSLKSMPDHLVNPILKKYINEIQDDSLQSGALKYFVGKTDPESVQMFINFLKNGKFHTTRTSLEGYIYFLFKNHSNPDEIYKNDPYSYLNKNSYSLIKKAIDRVSPK